MVFVFMIVVDLSGCMFFDNKCVWKVLVGVKRIVEDVFMVELGWYGICDFV